MGTPFSSIYELFLSQIRSRDIEKLLREEDGEEKVQKNMKLWLFNAIPSFILCKKDLESFNEEFQFFHETLSLIEQSILAKLMVRSYLMTYIVDDSNLKNHLNSKDYRQYSTANLIDKMKLLNNDIESENATLQSQYSWKGFTSWKEVEKK